MPAHYSTEIEQAVLGALLIDGEAIIQVAELLNEDLFYSKPHQFICKAMISLYRKGTKITFVSIIDEMHQQETINQVKECPSYLLKLSQFVNSSSSIAYHTNLLISYQIKRKCNEFADDLKKDKSNGLDTLNSARTQLKAIESLIPINPKDNLEVQSEEAMEKLRTRDVVDTIDTNIESFDRLIKIGRKELITIAGRPSMGKTLFVTNVVYHIAKNEPTIFFSLEMTAEQLLYRMWVAHAEVYAGKIKKKDYNDVDLGKLEQAKEYCEKLKLKIVDDGGVTLDYIISYCDRYIEKHGKLSVVVIDYLQLINITGKSKGTLEQDIASMTRRLKEYAKSKNVAMIVLAQLSRDVEKRGGDKVPQLSDLRSSGAIEQDSDTVIFIHRPEFYGIVDDGKGNSYKDVMNVIAGKHRNGELCTVKLKYEGHYQKISSYEESNDEFINPETIDESVLTNPNIPF